MIFSIKITSDECDPIEIGEEAGKITNVHIHMDTINNETKEKAMGMLAKIKITGKIDDSTKQAVIELFNWSKAVEKSKWYRTIEIKVIEDNNATIYRTYQFDKVFVVDYQEFYDSTTSEGSVEDHFVLDLTQKENNFKTIETY